MAERGTALSLALVSGLACSLATREERVRATPTFTSDIAPLVYEHCAPCHHEGGAGPFPLVTHEQVARRAKQIAIVTRSRFMPPWKPEPGHRELLDSRRLADEDVQLFARWARAGAPLGDPEELPPEPVFETEWTLGPPDLVLRMERDYVLPAEGLDVYRSFVIPTGFTEDHYLRAMDLRPTNARVLHHVFTLLDTSGMGRKADAEDEEPGFHGMISLTDALFGSEIHIWTQGTEAHFMPEEAAWLLPAGVDILLDTHWQTTGRPEVCNIELGLYFADEPPKKHLTNLSIESPPINIPPDDPEVVVEQRFELPVNARAVGVQPHAHYIARDVVIDVTRPGEAAERLLHIDDWDFNWQDAYRFAEPLDLPAGTQIYMRFRYDNSEANVNNPFYPRRRVLSGPKSADEMALIWLQVLTTEEDRERLLAREREVREATIGENQLYEALFRGIIFAFDADRNGYLDAEEERAAGEYVNGLREHPHAAAFDRDHDGTLDDGERAFLERAIRLWNGEAS